MYKVFIDNKEMILVQSWLKKSKKRTLVVRYEDFSAAKHIIDLRIELPAKKRLVVVCSDLEKQFESLFYRYRKLSTGGGVVRRKSSILAIFRLGKWDLPKGKLDKGETPEQAAQREIEEECGVSNLKLVSLICETYHTYEEKGANYLKRNYWFYYTYDGKKKLTPQTEEDISAAVWTKTSDLSDFEANSHASILEVLRVWKKKFG